MINYLTAEIGRIFKRPPLYIALTFIILISIMNVIFTLVMSLTQNTAVTADMAANVSARLFLNKFVAVITVYAVTAFTSEAGSNTVANAVAVGYTKNTIFITKLIVGILEIMLITVSSMIATLLMVTIWFDDVFTLMMMWQSVLKHVIAMTVYIAIYVTALTIRYLVNNMMLFTVLYFTLVLIVTEIASVLVEYSILPELTAYFIPTSQLEMLATESSAKIMGITIGASAAYGILTASAGAALLSKKDIL